MISGEYVCCSVVVGTLVGVSVFQGYVVQFADDICYKLSSMTINVQVSESGVCVHISSVY